MEDYLTINDIVEKLKVSRQTVYNWVKENRIKYIKIDKAIRFPASQFEEMEGK